MKMYDAKCRTIIYIRAIAESIDWWTDMHGGEKGTYTSNELANANTKSRFAW